MRIAIIYDWLTNKGGAERLLFSLLDVFPRADLFTMIYNPKIFPELKNRKIITSFLNHMPLAKCYWPVYAPLMPLAVESFDLRGYDVVISLSWSFSKGIITKPETIHISYLCTPTRFLWYPQIDQRAPKRGLTKRLIDYLKTWDKLAGERPDYYWAISKTAAGRIKDIYNRKSQIIYPAVDTGFFTPTNHSKEDYFLHVGRLIPYKRVDLAIAACQKLNLSLKIVGEGPEMGRLRRLAKKPNIQFLGRVNDQKLLQLYRRAKAVLFCSEEDFGLVPIEAMAAGTPVIAFEKGGAGEIVTSKTGILFSKQEAGSLVWTLKQFSKITFDQKDLISRAQDFSKLYFKKDIAKGLQNIIKLRAKGVMWT